MRDLRIAFAALAAMPLVVLGLPVFGYRRVHRWMARWPRRAEARALDAAESESRLRALARLVAAVSGPGRLRATCLRRSLLLWWLARIDGIETVLRVGVRREAEALHAHAWVEHRGRPVNDVADIASRFAPFDADLAS